MFQKIKYRAQIKELITNYNYKSYYNVQTCNTNMSNSNVKKPSIELESFNFKIYFLQVTAWLLSN